MNILRRMLRVPAFKSCGDPRVNHECLLVIVLASLVAVSRAQLVTIGPNDPSHCEREEVTSNLMVRESTTIKGILKDESGAPFKKLEVQLRESADQKTLKTATTEKNGEFDLGPTQAGRYRLVALTRAFKQPEDLQCIKKECMLEVTLKVEPTDGLYSQCPPK